MAFLLLLSAVVLIMVVMLGCGIGITTMIRRWLTPLSVLDLLFWDLVCFVPAFSVFGRLLSAVIGAILLKLGCGIGTSIGLGLITTLMSVLDYLYL